MSGGLPWTKFQDFYLRLGFAKALVAVLGFERRSIPSETILRRLRRPLFDEAAAHPELAARVADTLDWYPNDWPTRVFGKTEKRPSVAEALVVDADLPSFLFAITAPTTYKILDWGRNIGLIGRGNQIAERGLTLLALSRSDGMNAFLNGDASAWNPFALGTIERIFFLYHLIEIDRVTLRLCDAIGALDEAADIETLDAAKMLAAALAAVLEEAGSDIRPPDIPAYRTALELAATICEELDMAPPAGLGHGNRRAPKPLKLPARRKTTAAPGAIAAPRKTHKNADHQTIPRFEQLVDLGFLTKGADAEDRAARRRWRWRPTAAAARWAEARRAMAADGSSFLWDGFARTACRAYGDVAEPRRVEDTRTIAAYIADAYALVRRTVGYTPFDSVALVAMAKGVEDGIAIEMIDCHRLMLAIKTGGFLQGEVFFASGNDLDKMFVSLRADFAERAAAVLPPGLDERATELREEGKK